jgi:hypothetical protein
MKNILFITLLALATSFWGCDKPETVKNPDKPNITYAPCLGLDTFNLKDSNASSVRDPFSIVSNTVIGDNLKLTINYNGGCNDHNFKLVWNQYSMAPFMVVNIMHNANGDKCNQNFTRQLCFDISLLKKNTGGTHGIIQFPLRDTNGKSVQVKYYY